MAMIIDPPVTPYSPPEEIRKWREHLATRLEEVTDPEDKAAFRRAIERADRMLELRLSTDLSADEGGA